MNTSICEKLGIEFPLFAFSHCRDVVVEVSKAGGFGVLGAAAYTPEELEMELSWIDEHVQGMPYGVDLIIPDNIGVQGGAEQAADRQAMEEMIPAGHRDFVTGVLSRHEVDVANLYGEESATHGANMADNVQLAGAQRLLDVCFAHPIKLIANALGVPPAIMLERGKAEGVAVAALVGAKEHAVKQVEAGVDILVVSGGEAGGHCGDVSTMVLVPEVCRAVRGLGPVTVLAAGGIVTGEQMAGAMAMGADGAWTGSVWLTTREAHTSEVVKDKMIEARSRDTVRSKSRTGKYSRQLRSAWTEAWESDEAPAPLPMPLQGMLSEPALRRISSSAEIGHPGAQALSTYWVGQGVGLMNQRSAVRTVVQEFKEDFLGACERLQGVLE